MRTKEVPPCEVCGESWDDHDLGVPHPICPKPPLPGQRWEYPEGYEERVIEELYTQIVKQGREAFDTPDKRTLYRDNLAKVVGCAWYQSTKLLFATLKQQAEATSQTFKKIEEWKTKNSLTD